MSEENATDCTDEAHIESKKEEVISGYDSFQDFIKVNPRILRL